MTVTDEVVTETVTETVSEVVMTEMASSGYLNSVEWEIVDEPLPSKVRGITDAEANLANIAASDGRTRKAPIAAEDTLRAMSRYLDPQGKRIKYVLHPDGSLRWTIVKKREKNMNEEHIAKLRAAGKARSEKNATLRKRLEASLTKLNIKMIEGKPLDQATLKSLKMEFARHAQSNGQVS